MIGDTHIAAEGTLPDVEPTSSSEPAIADLTARAKPAANANAPGDSPPGDSSPASADSSGAAAEPANRAASDGASPADAADSSEHASTAEVAPTEASFSDAGTSADSSKHAAAPTMAVASEPSFTNELADAGTSADSSASTAEVARAEASFPDELANAGTSADSSEHASTAEVAPTEASFSDAGTSADSSDHAAAPTTAVASEPSIADQLADAVTSADSSDHPAAPTAVASEPSIADQLATAGSSADLSDHSAAPTTAVASEPSFTNELADAGTSADSSASTAEVARAEASFPDELANAGTSADSSEHASTAEVAPTEASFSDAGTSADSSDHAAAPTTAVASEPSIADQLATAGTSAESSEHAAAAELSFADAGTSADSSGHAVTTSVGSESSAHEFADAGTSVDSSAHAAAAVVTFAAPLVTDEVADAGTSADSSDHAATVAVASEPLFTNELADAGTSGDHAVAPTAAAAPLVTGEVVSALGGVDAGTSADSSKHAAAVASEPSFTNELANAGTSADSSDHSAAPTTAVASEPSIADQLADAGTSADSSDHSAAPTTAVASEPSIDQLADAGTSADSSDHSAAPTTAVASEPSFTNELADAGTSADSSDHAAAVGASAPPVDEEHDILATGHTSRKLPVLAPTVDDEHDILATGHTSRKLPVLAPPVDDEHDILATGHTSRKLPLVAPPVDDEHDILATGHTSRKLPVLAPPVDDEHDILATGHTSRTLPVLAPPVDDEHDILATGHTSRKIPLVGAREVSRKLPVVAAPASASASASASDERYQRRGELTPTDEGGETLQVEAFDTLLRRAVVVEEPSAEDGGRFQREVQLVARLQHPAIASVLDAGASATGVPFAVRGPANASKGRTLAEELEGRSTPEERMGLLPSVLAVADALGYAHANGVVHRDVRPTTIRVGEHGTVTLVGWGAAHDSAAVDEPDASSGFAASRTTTTADVANAGASGAFAASRAAGAGASGSFAASRAAGAGASGSFAASAGVDAEASAHGVASAPGAAASGAIASGASAHGANASGASAHGANAAGDANASTAHDAAAQDAGASRFASPELVRGEPVAPAMDVYSLGMTLAMVATGTAPFADASEADVRAKLAAGEADVPTSSQVPAGLATIIEKATAPLEQRYSNASELADDLRAFLAKRESGVAGGRRGWLRRNRVMLAGMLAVALGAGVAVRGALKQRDAARAQRADAMARRDELTLLQARDHVETDPTSTIAWLKEYPGSAPQGRVAELVEEAAARGVARHAWAIEGATPIDAAFAGNDSLVMATPDGAITRMALESGKRWVVARTGSMPVLVRATDEQVVAIDVDGELLRMDKVRGITRTRTSAASTATSMVLDDDEVLLGFADGKSVRVHGSAVTPNPEAEIDPRLPAERTVRWSANEAHYVVLTGAPDAETRAAFAPPPVADAGADAHAADSADPHAPTDPHAPADAHASPTRTPNALSVHVSMAGAPRAAAEDLTPDAHDAKRAARKPPKKLSEREQQDAAVLAAQRAAERAAQLIEERMAPPAPAVDAADGSAADSHSTSGHAKSGDAKPGSHGAKSGHAGSDGHSAKSGHAASDSHGAKSGHAAANDHAAASDHAKSASAKSDGHGSDAAKSDAKGSHGSDAAKSDAKGSHGTDDAKGSHGSDATKSSRGSDAAKSDAKGSHGSDAAKGHGSDPAKGHGSDAAKGHGSDAAKGHGSDAAKGHGSDPAKGHGSDAAKGHGSDAARSDAKGSHGSVAAKGHGSDSAKAHAAKLNGHGSTAAKGHGSDAANGHDSDAAKGHGSDAANGHGSDAAKGHGSDAAKGHGSDDAQSADHGSDSHDADAPGTQALWAGTGTEARLIATLPPCAGDQRALVTDDGATALLVRCGALAVYDAASGAQRFTLPVDHAPVLALSPDSRWLALGQGSMELVDLASGARRKLLGTAAVTSAGFSPDGKWMFTIGSEQGVRLWPLVPPPSSLRVSDAAVPTRMSLAPDGSIVLSRDGSCVRIDADTKAIERREAPANARPVAPWSISGDGRSCVFGTADGGALVVGETTRAFPTTVPFTGCVLAADGHLACRNQRDELVTVTEAGVSTQLEVGGKVRSLVRFRGDVVALVARKDDCALVGEDGREIVRFPGTDCVSARSDDTAITIAHPHALDVWTDGGRLSLPTDAAVTATATTAAVVKGPTVELWDLRTQARVDGPPAHARAVTDVAWSPAGVLASADAESIQLWDPTTRRARLVAASGVTTMVWSDDGKTLFTSDGRTVQGWPVEMSGDATEGRARLDELTSARIVDGRPVTP